MSSAFTDVPLPDFAAADLLVNGAQKKLAFPKMISESLKRARARGSGDHDRRAKPGPGDSASS
jgi:hypothetical protein